MTSVSDELRALAEKAENKELDEAARKLVDLRIEGFPELADPVCFACGWEKVEHEAIVGHRPGNAVGEDGKPDHEYEGQPDPETPFFSESYLYPLLGKGDARAILGTLRALLKAAGVSQSIINDL